MPRRKKVSLESPPGPPPELITLYRGDYNKVDRFSFDKTNRGLLGKGIYLTDNRKIAETYRCKGYYGYNYNNNVLGKGISEKQALRRAFSNFSGLVDMSGNIQGTPYEFPFIWNKTATKRQPPVFIDGQNIFMNEKLYKKLQELHASIIKQVWEEVQSKLIIKKPRIRGIYCVYLPIIPPIGHLSIFKIPHYEFTKLWILDYDGPIALDTVKILLQKKLFDLREVFIPSVRHLLPKMAVEEALELFQHTPLHKVQLGELLNSSDVNKFRKLALDLGYVGLRYDGGKHLGGERHNAYAIWDDDFINHFRIKDETDEE